VRKTTETAYDLPVVAGPFQAVMQGRRLEQGHRTILVRELFAVHEGQIEERALQPTGRAWLRSRISATIGAMDPPGNVIYRVHDDSGSIEVRDDGWRRTLSFGTPEEQSCMSRLTPHRLEHAYTQAMMLGTLFPDQLRSAAVLGLGGGSLARALLHFFPPCQVVAVEHREQVVAIARRFFGLPSCERLRVVVADAGAYLAAERESHDLIFADLYIAGGMDEQQVQEEFLTRCRLRLGPRGVLVVNLWNRDFRAARAAHRALAAAFREQLLIVAVQGGNSIAFAFKETIPCLQRRAFFTSAQTLGLRLTIPLQRLARNLWFQNASLLQYSHKGWEPG